MVALNAGTERVGEGVTALTLGETAGETENTGVVDGVPDSVLPLAKREGDPPSGESEAERDTKGLGDIEIEMAGVDDELAEKEVNEESEGEPELLSLPKPTVGVFKADSVGPPLPVKEKKADGVAIGEPVEHLVPKAVAEDDFEGEGVVLKETVEVEVLESVPAPGLP